MDGCSEGDEVATAAERTGFEGAESTATGTNKPPPSTRRCCLCSWKCGCGWLWGCLVAAATVWLIVCLVGRSFERAKWELAAGTADLYATPRVCGRIVGAETTFDNITSLAAVSVEPPVHCGDCGQCSNAGDMKIYRDTKDTLTRTATNCAYRGFVLGHDAVEACFRDKVGFTEGCARCWSDNGACSRSNCKYTCTLSLLVGEENNDETGELTSCLLCDERMCGHAFLACAGANRRRAGVATDIKRAETEICLS